MSQKFLIAFSGGLDSTVLLHRYKDRAVKALHVNHHLQPESDKWAKHCKSLCESWNIPCEVIDVFPDKNPEEGIEAEARRLRYAAFEKFIEKNSVLLTAHHQDDQAETLLIQLVRGAGVKGLAAMPFEKSFGQGVHQRPLLNESRESLLVYAKEHDLTWIEDPSNLNTQFLRNYIRHDVMPLLKKFEAGVTTSIARSAQHCAEVSSLLDDLAQIDLQQCEQDGRLKISSVNKLSQARQSNLVRHWIHSHGFKLPSAVKCQQIFDEVIAAKEDANPCVSWSGAEVRRYRDDLYAMKPLESFSASQVFQWDCQSVLQLPHCRFDVNAQLMPGSQPLSELSSVEIRFRQGGESMKLQGRKGTHSLKNLFQEWGVPTWQRDRVPLLFQNGTLVSVINHSFS